MAISAGGADDSAPEGAVAGPDTTDPEVEGSAAVALAVAFGKSLAECNFLEDCSRQNLSPGAKNARGQIIKTGSACSRGNLSPGANCYGGFVPGRNFL